MKASHQQSGRSEVYAGRAGNASICGSCGKALKPKRSSRRQQYCGDRCKDEARRGRNFAKTASTGVSRGRRQGTMAFPRPNQKSPAIPVASEPENHGQGSVVGAGLGLCPDIVPDMTYPGMWRIRQPDGSLSDMVNLTRAKDLVARC